MSTCNWLDLQTLGSQLVMPKILPDYWPNHLPGKWSQMVIWWNPHPSTVVPKLTHKPSICTRICKDL